jgi:hypothetical protein
MHPVFPEHSVNSATTFPAREGTCPATTYRACYRWHYFIVVSFVCLIGWFTSSPSMVAAAMSA